MIDGRRNRRSAPRPAPDAPPPPTRFWKRIQLGRRLHALGVSADAVTLVGMLIAAATALSVGTGHLLLGTGLLIIGGLMDALDGAVAKAAGRTTLRGAFFDSVADRVSDFLIFGGVAWYLLDGRDPRLALLPVAILGVSSLISYERAKAESLGFQARGGLMERAERLIVLGAALAFHLVMVPLLIVLLVASTATAAGRFLRVWRQASGAPVPTPRFFGPGSVESRWRARREAGALRPERHARRRARREAGTLPTRLRKALGVPGTVSAGVGTRPSRDRTARALRRRVDSGQ